MPCAAACPTRGAHRARRTAGAGYRLGALELHPERCITFRGTAVPRLCRCVSGGRGRARDR